MKKDGPQSLYFPILQTTKYVVNEMSKIPRFRTPC